MKTNIHKILTNYRNTKITNSSIHFLSQAPILKKFFNKDLVEEYEAKRGINLLINTILYLFDFFKKIVYGFILLIIAINFSNGFVYFLILLTICGTIIRKINKLDFNDYNNIVLLKINSLQYARYKINYYIIKEFFMILLAMLMLKKNFFVTLFMTAIYISIHLIGEAIYINKIEKNNFELNKNIVLKFISAGLIIILGIVSYYTKVYLIDKWSYCLGIIFVVLGIFSYKYLMNYRHYKEIHKYNLNINVVNNYKLSKENLKANEFASVSINSMDKKIKHNINMKNKTGYEYLHSLLLNRYGKSLKKDIVIGTLLTTIFCLIILLLPIIIKTIEPQKYVNIILDQVGTLFLIMYSISYIGNRVLKLCFFQVDRYMINYNFYRCEQAIKTNFRLRLKSVFSKNLMPAIIVSSCFVLFLILYSESIDYIKIIIAFIYPIVLSIFFSLYHISTYYLFQPYAFDGTVVNKAFSFVNYLVYFLVYQFYSSSIVFDVKTSISIICILFLVSVVLYNIVKKKGIKTFRVR